MIVLEILKIIGIVLACIVGLVLLIVIIVMIAPFRYQLHLAGDSEKNQIGADAYVKWLLGFVTFRADFADKVLNYYLRVAGIKFLKGNIEIGKEDKDSDEEKPAETADADQTVSEADSSVSETGVEISREDILEKRRIQGMDNKDIYKEMNEDIRREEKELKEKEKEAKAAEKQRKKEEKENEKEKKSFSERIEDLSEKIISLNEKLMEIIEKIKAAQYILGAPVTQRALELVKEQLGHILGSIRPRYLIGNLGYSTGDPSSTALIYGIGGHMAQMIDERFTIDPYVDSDEFRIDGDVKTGGRLIVGYLAICAVKVILNKNVRRVIKYTKKQFAKSN